MVLGYLFYQHPIGMILLFPMVILYFKMKKKSLIKERRWKLNLEFMDGIQALSAALEAGYSAEHALEEASRDLLHIYSEKSMIIKEFNYMINQVHMNIPVEKALEDFGRRSGVEDIRNFSEVFGTAKRTGGDMPQIIKISRDIICDKIEVKREIVTMISAKRLEANIMKFIPVIILAYLMLSSPDFLKPMYHNLFGIILMSIFLLIYFGAFLLIDRIVSIEV
jgi:tight adherence protein B